MKQHNDKHLTQLADLFFENKRRIEQLEAENKAVLQELWDLTGEQDCFVGNHKLSQVSRAGSISYARIVKERLPGLDVEQYRGAPSQYLQLK